MRIETKGPKQLFLLVLMILTLHLSVQAQARFCEAIFATNGPHSLGGGVGGETTLSHSDDGGLVVTKRYYLTGQFESDVAVLNRLTTTPREPGDFQIVKVISAEGRILRTQPVNGTPLDQSMNDPRIAALYHERLARLVLSLQQTGLATRFEAPDTLVGGWMEGYAPKLMMIKPDNVILGPNGEMTIVDPY